MKWEILRNNIYTRKLREIDKVFENVDYNLKNGIPRPIAYAPLTKWLKTQSINTVRLSIKEYTELSDMVELIKKDINESNDKENAIQLYKENLKINFIRMLHNHAADLKLEIAAELVKKHNFPIEIYEEYVLYFKDSSLQQFNEGMGEFWGDVAKGAGVGAAAGGVVGGGLPGALTGLATGGLMGGAYSGAKHLLRKVWQWYKDHSNYVRSKDDALEILRRLQYHSKQVGIGDDRYHQAIDDLIRYLSDKPPKPKKEEIPLALPTDEEKPIYPTPEEELTIKRSIGEDIPVTEPSQKTLSKPAISTAKVPQVEPTTSQVKVPPVEEPTALPKIKPSDIAIKIDGGEGKGESGNFNKLLNGKIEEIDDNGKKQIALLGKALYELGKYETKWNRLDINQINDKMIEMQNQEISELDKHRFIKMAENYVQKILKGKINREGGWARLGLKGFFYGAKPRPVATIKPSAAEPKTETPPEAAAPVKTTIKPSAAEPKTETPPEAAAPVKTEELPYPQFKKENWPLDIAAKIDAGQGNLLKLKNKRFIEIADDKSKNIILLLGKALKKIGEPNWKTATVDDINAKIKEIYPESISGSDIYYAPRIVWDYFNKVLNKKIDELGGLKKLGISLKKQYEKKDDELELTVTEPEREVKPEEIEEEKPSLAKPIGTTDIPEDKSKSLGQVDETSFSHWEKEIFTMDRDKLAEKLHKLFDIDTKAKQFFKLEGTPALDMVTDPSLLGRPGTPKGIEARKKLIASLRKAFNKESINDDADLSESVTQMFKRLLKEQNRPVIMTYRSKGMSVDDRIKLYKEALKKRQLLL